MNAVAPAALTRYQPTPDIRLTLPDGSSDSIRSTRFRHDRIVFFLPSAPSTLRESFLAELSEHRNVWEDWGAHAWVLATDSLPRFEIRTIHTATISPAAHHQYGGEQDRIVAVFLDFRGTVMETFIATESSPLNWHETAETVRWIAVQEPECGVCGVDPVWQQHLSE
ncbi:MAG: hypothetical protein OHK0029_29990 [Armatimonadaceae bacterium]